MHYDTLEQVFLDTEIASGCVHGPGGTSIADLKWVKPGLVASCDESRVTTNGENEAHSENHIELILRPPNTTSKVQPEDAVLSKQFKSTWHQWKEDVLLRRIDALDAIRKGPTGLGNEKPTAATTTWEDVCMGIKLAHERAFTKENVMAAWAAVGVRPFNRRVHRNLLGKENEAKVAATQARAVKVVALAEACVRAGATSTAFLPVPMSQGRNTAGESTGSGHSPVLRLWQCARRSWKRKRKLRRTNRKGRAMLPLISWHEERQPRKSWRLMSWTPPK
jgi:hypothetical protein